jgi:hypothetical protein
MSYELDNALPISHRVTSLVGIFIGLFCFITQTALPVAGQASSSFTMTVKTTDNKSLVVIPDPFSNATATEQSKCTVTNFKPRQPAPIIGGLDPNKVTSNPVTAATCNVFDQTYGWEWPLAFTFSSLKDLGTWTIVCDGYSFDMTSCQAANVQPCGLFCNPYTLTKWQNTFTWIVTVQNNPPQVKLAPTTFHGSKSDVTLSINITDPDGGPAARVPNAWRFAGPNGRTVTPTMLNNNTEAQATFDHPLDVGSWSIHIDVIDGQGEQTTQTVDFTVTDNKPVVTVSANGMPGNLWTMWATDQLPFTVLATDADGDDTSLTCVAQGPNGKNTLPKGAVLPAIAAQKPPVTGMFTFSPGKPDIGTWKFSCDAVTDLATVTSTFTVDVQPKQPQAKLLSGAFPPAIPEGSDITLVADNHDAYGDPFKTIQWDLIQGPGANPPGQTDAVGSGATFTMAKPAPGTWRFRLTVTDDVAQSDKKDDIFVLVDSKPHISINDPGIVNVLQAFTLDGSASSDPDYDSPHWVVQPYVVTLKSEAPTYQWRLISWPADADPNLIYQGTVDDVFNLNGSAKTLMFPAVTLFPDDWLFELDVTDSQGNQDSGVVAVVVAGLNLPPIAIINPPARIYTVTGVQDPLKFLDGFTDVTFDASMSFDPDALLKNLGRGIQSYAWQVLDQPNGCNLKPPWDNGALSTASVAMGFQQMNGVPNACLGTYHVMVAATDQDMPKAHTGFNTALAVVVNCKDVICIDHPTQQDPEFVPLAQKTDVLIYYHLSSLFNQQPIYNPQSPFGLNGARIQLFISKDENNATIPVFSNTYDIDPAPNQVSGGERVLNWAGYDTQNRHPASGKYNVALQLLDGAGNNSSKVTEQHAILIQTLDVSLNSVDRYIDGTLLPKSPIQVTWDVSGAKYVKPGFDQLRLVVFDQTGTEVGHKDEPSNSLNPLAWDGSTDKGQLPPGEYFLQLEAIKNDGTVLGASTELPFTVYQIGFHLASGAKPPAMVALFVNNDDDDLNGISDLNDMRKDDDLVELAIDVLPSTLDGTLTLSNGGGFLVWPKNDKSGVQIAMPATYAANAIPKSVTLEGTSASLTYLTAEFVTTQGNVKLNPAKLPIDTIELAIMLDTNGDFRASPGDIESLYVQLGLWDFAFRVNADANGAANTLYDEQDDPNNFVGRDSHRFYYWLNDPAANTDNGKIEEIPLANLQWYTRKPDKVTDEDHPANAGITLTETLPGSGVFVSKALMLVSDQVDTNEPTDTGLPAHPGKSGPGVANHRTRRVDGIDDLMVAAYQSQLPGASPHLLLTPTFSRTNDMLSNRRTLSVHIFNFSDTNKGVAKTPQPTIDVMMKEFSRRFAPLGIRINIIGNDVIDLPMGSPINLNMVAGFMSVLDGAVPCGTRVTASGDQLALIGLIRAVDPASKVNENVYYIAVVPNLAANRGESFPDGYEKPGVMEKNFTFLSGAAMQMDYVPAHEAAHMLVNETMTNAEANAMAPGWTPGGHFGGASAALQQRFNVMEPGGTSAPPGPRADNETRRFWNDPEPMPYPHIIQQIKRARLSRFLSTP